MARNQSLANLFHISDLSYKNMVRTPSLLRKVVAQVSFFHIWKQMNNILHNVQVIPSRMMFRIIDRDIINTINSKKYKKRWNDLMFLGIEQNHSTSIPFLCNLVFNIFCQGFIFKEELACNTSNFTFLAKKKEKNYCT